MTQQSWNLREIGVNANGESHKFLEEKHSGEIKSKCENLETEGAQIVYLCKH